jgi:AraC-like DNA-binding protein
VFRISRTRLYECIRPYFEKGLAAYIKDKRLEHAKYLIKTSDLSMTEIAHACGFADYNYFLRVFKKKYGVASKQLRRASQTSSSKNN